MIPSGPTGEHLFTIAVGPAVFDGYGSAPQVLMVSFTSVKQGVPPDDACLVSAGEHPFITRESFVYYREPRMYPVADVQDRVNRQVWRPEEPCSQALLAKVMQGFWRSDRLPRGFKRMLENAGY